MARLEPSYSAQHVDFAREYPSLNSVGEGVSGVNDLSDLSVKDK
ncbi:MAG: hypothetical protein U0N74_06145 [Peptococcaceae bacterium]|nr:hypothetical protein [Peptococcaceae bacterium]